MLSNSTLLTKVHVSFLYPLKMWVNQRFFNIFRGYRNCTLAWNSSIKGYFGCFNNKWPTVKCILSCSCLINSPGFLKEDSVLKKHPFRWPNIEDKTLRKKIFQKRQLLPCPCFILLYFVPDWLGKICRYYMNVHFSQ